MAVYYLTSAGQSHVSLCAGGIHIVMNGKGILCVQPDVHTPGKQGRVKDNKVPGG